MDIQEIVSLFDLFVGEEIGDTYIRIINLAICEVLDMLRDGADRTDARLEYLAAALAYYRYQQILAARERAAVTYGGKVLSESQNTAYEYSKQLLSDYMQICRKFIKADTFVFAGISNGREEI
ncbi:MAG: hypothetical protein IKH78_00650 [Ruminococcus sp.]|nr:hypothetical protein [Ruminococcus sp.]